MKKRILIFLAGFALVALTACVDMDDISSGKESVWEAESVQEAENVQTAENAETLKEETAGTEENVGSVPFFRDDTGEWLQSADGYLYGYLNGTLCRYDKETFEKTVLYETCSNHLISFCIHEGYVYLTDRPYCTSLTGADVILYRVRCDGTELVALMTEIPNPGSGEFIDNYSVDIYEDVLYLMRCRREECLYYRMNPDGSLTEIPEEDTLYNMLPGGYTPAFYSLPYYMRNYGYAFAWDKQNNLYQILFKNGRRHKSRKITLPEKVDALGTFTLTNNALFCISRGDTILYRLGLDDLENPEIQMAIEKKEWGTLGRWDETGVYILSYNAEGSFLIRKVGEEVCFNISLADFQIDEDFSLQEIWIDSGYLYYKSQQDFDKNIMRVSLSKETEPELVDHYCKDEIATISRTETNEQARVVSETGELYINFTRLFLEGNTDGENRINAYLNELYKDIETEIDAETEELREFREEYDGDLGAYDSGFFSIRTFVEYLDEKYIVICVDYEEYWYPAAHEIYWLDEYVFNRATGERLSITDIVSNTEEEICDIVSAYVEANNYSWSESVPEATVLEQDRLFLTEEGIGIHYDVYEMGSYPEGSIDFIIPYREFEMR